MTSPTKACEVVVIDDEEEEIDGRSSRRETSHYKSLENELKKSNCREIQRSDSGNASISSLTSTTSSTAKISSRDPRIFDTSFDLDAFSSPSIAQVSSDEEDMPANSFIALYERSKRKSAEKLRKSDENSALKVKSE